MKISKLEKLINNNCFIVFIILFILVICYVIELHNRPIKENFIPELKREFRNNVKKIDNKIANKKIKIQRNFRKGIRNFKRDIHEKKENLIQKIKNKFKIA